MKTTPHLFIFDGFADWEAAYATAELRRSGGHQITTIGLSGEPVVSMGGLCILPDVDVAELDAETVRILILPGGDMWEKGPPDDAVSALLQKLARARTPIAAICAATTAVVRAGVLQGRKHTSNGLDYLKEQVPEYAAAADYVDQLAVRDRGLITASGLGAVEFAREIFAQLGVFSDADRAEWYQLFKQGKTGA